MLHLVVIMCAKMKVKISGYILQQVCYLILYIVSTTRKHENENRNIDFDVYILTIFILFFYQITLSFICHMSLYMAIF